MPSFVPQGSFTGGEIAPSLGARQDLAKFAVSLKTCKNMIVHAHGGASNRSGTAFTGAARYAGKVARLIPFSFSTEQTYSLEFGDSYMRVIKDGGHVLEAAVAITGVTQASPAVVQTGAAHGYITGEEVYIQGVLGMTELNGKRFIVTNVDATHFSLDGVDSTAYTAYSSAGTVARIFTLATPYAEADLPLLKFTQSADVMTIDHTSHADRELSRTAHDAWTLATVTRGTTLTAPAGLAVVASGFAGAAANYAYQVTAVGGGDESLPTALVTQAGDNPWPAGALQSLSWSASSGAEYYNIYKRSFDAGSFGYIGNTTALTFTDDNITAGFDQTPPPGNADPFSGAGNYPACVAYHQQRLFHAGSDNGPQTVYASKSGTYHNFNVSIPPRDDDSLELTIAAREVNRIRHLVPMSDALLAMTTGHPWAIRASGAEALTPSNRDATPQGKRGASNVPPLVIGNTILFIQEKGSVVRDMAFTFQDNLYDGTDRSILANHLFEGRTIKEWAYAEVPDSIIWCVMSDGALLGFTYIKEHEVWAWHKHDTDGKFESVCTIAEGDIDAVYVIVKRKINGATVRYVERLHSRFFIEVEDAFFLDSGLTYDVPLTVSGVTQADPVVVTVTGHGFSAGDIVDFSSAVGVPELRGQRYKVGTPLTNTFELLNQYTDATIDGTAFTAYDADEPDIVRKAVTTISGLDHLEGKAVAVLANGNVVGDKTVTAGAITLTTAASRVHVGLPYVSDIETLPTDFYGNVNAYGKGQHAGALILDLLKTRGFFAGFDENNLDEFKQRGLADEAWGQPAALFTGRYEQAIATRWAKGGTFLVRQVDPLPITIRSIAPGRNIGE